MASFNSFMLMGRLAAAPELRYQPNGAPVCTFPLAVNSRRKNSAGQTVEHVDFFRITAKFRLADVCMQFLKKGRAVFVAGELASWKSEGRFGIHFVATNVQFLGASQNAGQEGDAQDPGGQEDSASGIDPWLAAYDAAEMPR